MKNKKYYQPKNPFHPGEILLEEFLEPSNTTQSDFAEKLGWTKAKLNELIKGKRYNCADRIRFSRCIRRNPKAVAQFAGYLRSRQSYQKP